MIAKGIAATPDVVAVALGLAAIVLGRGRLFLRDWIPFLVLFFAYELMRGYADQFGQQVHIGDVIALERALFGGQLPTTILQAWLHPKSGIDPWAVAATVVYFLHFPLPLAVGFLLWLRRRAAYYDFVAALVVLSMAAFVTYVLLPVAPPWWAEQRGYLPPGAVLPLKELGFLALATTFGFDGHYVYSYAFYNINPNQLAAIPSLHAAYPFLAFLVARHYFGRAGWLMLLYSAAVWFSIVYLGEHHVVDAMAGVLYASLAYWLVLHARTVIRVVAEIWPSAAIAGALPSGSAGQNVHDIQSRRSGFVDIAQGGASCALGVAVAAAMVTTGFAGGPRSPLYLLPWVAILVGLWRASMAFRHD
ncbi:MAG: phosphatase PAP2 family protein [Chloroflexi bacterium]|nr:phosphatase PAP2 family protein [Chloroflexota bacterium]